MDQAPRATPPPSLEEQARFAQAVIDAEARALAGLRIDEAFHRAVDMIVAATGAADAAGAGHGSVVVCGLGKSGIIGRKIAATLASTGTPSHYLHPTEALHGDLGRIRRHDLVLMLSFGGQTEELLTLATILRQDGVAILSITGKAESDLGRLSDVALSLGDITEACPMNLAPTASTTAMLALGDALAMTVMWRRNFGVEDFRRVHPGGNLGRMLMPIAAAMRFRAGENLPLIQAQVTLEQAYDQAERFAQQTGLRRAGALLVVDDGQRLIGIFTDGDLRRTFIRNGSQAWRQPIGQFMTRRPRCLAHDALVRDAVHIVRELRIDEVPVVDGDGRVVGLIDVQDLMALKVIEG